MVPTTVASTPKWASVWTSTCAVRALTSAESARVGGLAFRSVRSGRRYSAPPAGAWNTSAASSAVDSSSGSGGSSGGGSADSGPAATTSGNASTPSTGAAAPRTAGRTSGSGPSADDAESLQSAHSMLSIERRAAVPAWRTA